MRSKPPEELEREIRALAEKGYGEMVLVGINLTAYGQEWGQTIADAVDTACAVEGVRRIRLGSLEPDALDEATIARLGGPAGALSPVSPFPAERLRRHPAEDEPAIRYRRLRGGMRPLCAGPFPVAR